MADAPDKARDKARDYARHVVLVRLIVEYRTRLLKGWEMRPHELAAVQRSLGSAISEARQIERRWPQLRDWGAGGSAPSPSSRERAGGPVAAPESTTRAKPLTPPTQLFSPGSEATPPKRPGDR